MEIIADIVNSCLGEMALITIRGNYGYTIGLSNLGAGITSLVVPDRRGTMADIALGYANPADYMADGPCAGKTPGRYANRIAGGRFAVDGRRYQLVCNNGANALHGGPTGFMNRLWEWTLLDDGVRFSRLSPDGEEGYPGNMRVVVEYRWDDESHTLRIGYYAETDRTTIVNLTNHVYFNLSGHDSGSCLEHELQLNCPLWLPVDDTDIPLSDRCELVAGTPVDFMRAKPLGQDISADFSTLRVGKGYNHYFMFDDYDGSGTLRPIAVLTDRRSGRKVEIVTTYPGAMVYTGNWLDGSPLCKDSLRPYADHDGVAIECQYAPDAPNRPGLPQATLYPGQRYSHIITYRFDVSD